MGMGKVFAGLSIIAVWAVVVYGIIENTEVLKIFISSPTERAAFLNSFNAVQPVAWLIVMLIGLGIIIWGLKD